jgi:hypothetical protein
MATFSSFSASATLNFAATESFTNGPIICFNGTVTATSSLSASNGGRYVIWGASNYGLTGYNYLTLMTSSISGSNLNVFIDVSKQLAGVDFGAYCESIIDTYVEGQNLYDLFSSHYIILSQSFLYPTIVVSPATLSFGNVYSNTQATTNFSVEGYNLLTDLTISSLVSGTFRISTDGFDYVDSLTLSPYDGVISPTTLYTQFTPNYILGRRSGSIVFSSSVASASAFVTGSGIQEPLIYTNFTGFTSDYGDVLINKSSSQQQFAISGSYLTSNITVSAGSGFLVSRISGSSYSSSFVVTQSGGSVPLTQIYSVFYPTESGSPVSFITIESLYATSVNQLVEGTALSPSIYFDPALINFGVMTNGVTSSQFEFLVSGSGILDHIKINPGVPGTPVRISLTSGSGFSASSLILTQSANLVAPTTIYTVMIPVTEPAGNFSSAFKLDTTGSAQQLLTITGSIS